MDAEKSTFTGKVKFFYDTKGYGFITEDSESKDYFFHFSGMLDQVRKDDKVSFELVEGQKGPKAVKIKRII